MTPRRINGVLTRSELAGLYPQPNALHRKHSLYVVRDARGMAVHVGRTKSAAIRPYKGAVFRTQKDRKNYQRSNMWKYLTRRGWRCRREAIVNAPPPPPQS